MGAGHVLASAFPLHAEHLFEYNVALLAAHPVVVVAFYAARLAPDEFKGVTTERRFATVPAWWTERRWRILLIRVFTTLEPPLAGRSGHWAPDMEIKIPLYRFDADADRVFRLWFPIGLAATLAGLATADAQWPCRIATAASLLILAFNATSLSRFVSQALALRAIANAPPDPARQTAPFDALRTTVVINVIALSIAGAAAVFVL